MVLVRVLYPTLICEYVISSVNIENFFVRRYCETEERRSRLLMSDHHLYLLELSADNWEEGFCVCNLDPSNKAGS